MVPAPDAADAPLNRPPALAATEPATGQPPAADPDPAIFGPDLAAFDPPEPAVPAGIAALPYLLAAYAADVTTEPDLGALQRICGLLRAQTGHDFSGYKRNTILRRIERRMHQHQLATLADYTHYLRGHPAEVGMLFRELLIGVTRFFRDPDAFDALQEHLCPLVLAKPVEGVIRVWAAGCSTGEEAYSLAIVLLECLDGLDTDRHLRLQLFASDISADAIAVARAGRYPAEIGPDVGPVRLARFFQPVPEATGGGYQVRQFVRDRVIFARHDINKDAPFTRLDLLSCRNLLIYFGADLQHALIPVFHYALQPGGLLLLGPSENLTAFPELFAPLNVKWKLARRAETLLPLTRLARSPFVAPPLAPPLALALVAAPPTPLPLPTPALPRVTEVGPLAALVQNTLLRAHTPAAVVITPIGELLYVHGRTGRYLEPAPGPGTLNVFEMARESLRYALRDAVQRALQAHEDVLVPRVRVKTDGGYELLRLHVRPLPTLQPPLLSDAPTPLPTLLLLVAFEALPTPRRVRAGHPDGGTTDSVSADDVATRDALLAGLEAELLGTRHQLQITVEDMEITVEELRSTNEELQSANEELQSTNEELQSTNEEAMTNKEEMQSLNEELMTLNLQHVVKTAELLQGANDMKNLLDATEIAILFLDNDLAIKRFTPAVARIIPLLPTDLGRPLAHFATHLRYEHLMADVRQVINRLVPLDITLQALSGEWYALRVMPYRTLDHYISGAVLTFTDITTIKRLEATTQQALAFSASMQQGVREPVVVVDGPEQRVFFASASFAALLGTTPAALEGQALPALGAGWDQPALGEALGRLLDPTSASDAATADTFNGLTLAQPVALPGTGPRRLTLYGRRLVAPGGVSSRALLGVDAVLPG